MGGKLNLISTSINWYNTFQRLEAFAMYKDYCKTTPVAHIPFFSAMKREVARAAREALLVSQSIVNFAEFLLLAMLLIMMQTDPLIL